jgi:hypothetical protein
MIFCAPRSCLRFLCIAAAVLGSAAFAFAEAAKKNPSAKLYVADMTGESKIDSGQKIQTLAKNGVYSPEGAVIETKANATDSLVLSNGTAIYVTPETRFEVKKFSQEPFTPNRNDLDVEPSISQTHIRLVRGSVGVCTGKLVAGSTMTYQTPQASINIRGRRVMIETTEHETRVTLLEGDVTVIAEGSSESQTLQPGQQAIVRKNSPDEVAAVTVRSIPDADVTKLDDTVALACIARRTVAFESVEDGNGGSNIVPVRTTPATPNDFTVSPSRIGG